MVVAWPGRAEDIAAAAKIINKLAKDEKVVVRAGMIDGKAYDAKGASRIADLPTKTEAQAMFVRAMRAPLVKLGRIAKAPTRRLGTRTASTQGKIGRLRFSVAVLNLTLFNHRDRTIITLF